ncbi:MAG: glycosyltransferase [Actinobacteria bacterium]|nr:glycosyltransferase [Actinomycetota bacterium]
MVVRFVAGENAERPNARRFALAGVGATVVDVGVAVGLVSAGLGRLPAGAAALVIAAIVSRILHARYTLRGDQLDRWIRQPPVFATVAVIAGVVDLAVFLGLSSLAAFPAKCVAVAISAVIRGLSHRLVLFRVVRREQSSPMRRPAPDGEMRVSVVVPAYREEARIAVTVARIRRELDVFTGDLEIIVVDDGSPDGTADAARRAGADQVVVQPQNHGKGAAVRAGVLAARGRTIAFTDADLAYSPHQLVAFVEAIEGGYDVAIGNRHHADTDTMVGTSSVRSFGSRVVNMATSLMLLGNYRDTQCGCKAFRADAARIVVGAGSIDGFAFDIEVLHLVERYGLSMIELPVEVVNSDTSTVRALRDGVGVLLDILRIRRLSQQARYPQRAANALPIEAGRPMMGMSDDAELTDPHMTPEAEPDQ